jgi:hypothetical protein
MCALQRSSRSSTTCPAARASSTPPTSTQSGKAGSEPSTTGRSSLWVAEQLGRPVVKAWSTITSGSFAAHDTPAGSPDRIALPVAADADADRALGMSLVEDTGLDAVDAGTLAESWRQQRDTPCYVTDLTRQELPAALAAAVATRSPKRRDLAMTVIRGLMDDPTANLGADFGVRLSRLLHMWPRRSPAPPSALRRHSDGRCRHSVQPAWEVVTAPADQRDRARQPARRRGQGAQPARRVERPCGAEVSRRRGDSPAGGALPAGRPRRAG